MIKIPWVPCVFDPQYAAIVSARLHKGPDAAVATEETQYAKLSHSCQKADAFAEFASKKPPPAPTLNPQPAHPPSPAIILTLTACWPVTFLFFFLKTTLKRGGNTSMRGQTQKVVTLFNGQALRSANGTLSRRAVETPFWEGMCNLRSRPN